MRDSSFNSGMLGDCISIQLESDSKLNPEAGLNSNLGLELKMIGGFSSKWDSKSNRNPNMNWSQNIGIQNKERPGLDSVLDWDQG